MIYKVSSLGLGVLVAGLLSLAFLLPAAQALDQGCTVIDFESIPDSITGALVGDHYIGYGATFETFSAARAVAWDVFDRGTHRDAVCGCVPSGNKVAHLSIGESGPKCGSTLDDQPGAFIYFNPPVQSVRFQYVACNTVFLEAYDADGKSLGKVSGPKTDGQKPHCYFRPLEIRFLNYIISKVEIRGVSMIDDLEYCRVPQQVQDVCQEKKKPSMLTMQYTGQGCAASTNAQEPGKTSCTGDPEFASPVRIVATDKSGSSGCRANVWFDGIVNLNDRFVIDANNAGEDRLKADIYMNIYSTGGSQRLLQSIKFNTSCSQPLRTGDQFGSLLLEGCAFGLDKDFCSSGLRPQVLTMEYTADGCSATNHSQYAGGVSCADYGSLPATVYIRVVGENDARKALFRGVVTRGQTFDIDAGECKLGPIVIVKIYAFWGGPLLQQVQFSTSCAQPLIDGDQFGSLVLRGGVFVSK